MADMYNESGHSSDVRAAREALGAVSQDLATRRLEEDLDATRRRLRQLLVAVPAILYTRAAVAPYPLTFVTRDVAARLGRGQEERSLDDERFWESSVHPDDLERVRAHVRGSGDRASGFCEYRIRHGDGTDHWVHDESTLARGADDVEIVGCWLDVTALKVSELTLAQRTRRLARSNQELEQFAHVASHDLRAPLCAVDTLAWWLENELGELLQGEAREQMRLMRKRVRRMDRLVSDLLEYARAGRVRMPVEVVDSAVLVHDIIDLSQLDRATKIELSPSLPRFSTARHPLERVLMNLLVNAVKHHDRPPGHVFVTCVDRGDAFEFAVVDDGPGIRREFHERIFQMFQTLRPRDAVEGSGMGLALVLRLVESAGGRLSVDSGKGRGATFRFTWPKTWHDAPPPIPAEPVAAADALEDVASGW